MMKYETKILHRS